jgi:dTMP kinase
MIVKKSALKIEVEGTDGAGKTTALKYMIEQLQKRGSKVLETREVGNPHIPVCVKLRQTVLDPESNMSGEAMELVFSAMRFENDRLYRKIAQDYDVVVSDRGWFSHLSYTDHNVTPEFTNDLYLNFMQKYTLLPDVVIYFAVDTQTALQRRVKRGEGMADAIEMKGVGYQELVRGSFVKYLGQASDKNLCQIYTVNANDTIEGVRQQMDAIVDTILGVNTLDTVNA